MPRLIDPRRLAHRVAAMLLIIPLWVAAGRVGAQVAAGASTREDSVRAVEMARRQAVLDADTVALSRLVATEFYEISRLGTLRTRADNMREIATGDLKLFTIKYDSLAVHVYGNVAVLSGIADNKGQFRGFPFAGKIRYTRVFVWRDGRWQAVMMQQTPMP